MSKTVNLSTYYYNKNDIDTKLAEYYKKTEIDTKLSNKSKVSFTPKKTSGIEIGTINIDGTDTKIYQQDNNTTYTAESTASNIKMNGTQSAGSSTTYARGDHVHPTDTSRAASNHTHGNLQNNGKVGTSNNASKNVVTDSNGTLTTEDKPTIPTASSTASDIKVNGTQSAGTSSNFAKADHVHPTDTSRAASNHVHGNINNNGTITNAAYKNVVTDADGKITTEAKPTIPTKTSDLTNDSGFITSVSGKADKTGGVAQVTDANSNNYTNIGSMSSGATQQTINDNINTKFGNAIYKSTTNGYIKNDGTVGTPTDTKYTAESTATNIKMNGTQSAGSLSTYARGDHVHPTDSSRAPVAHAVNATTYGLSTSGVYGHTKIIENLTTNAGNGLALGAGQGKALKTMIDNIISGETSTDHNHDGSYIKTGTGTVTSTNIADGTIVNGDIANTTITGGKLVNGTITATQLASNAVETAKIKDSAVTNAKLADPSNTVTEYIVGTHGTTATNVWTGTSTKINSLSTGQVIFFKMTSAGTSTAATLNLTLANGTTTGAKNVRYNSATNLTTHFPQNTVLELVYDGTYWICTAIQNTNNYDRVSSTSNIVNGESSEVAAYTLMWGKTDKKYYKIAANGVFNIRYPIVWLGAKVASGSATNNVYSLYSGVNLQNTISGKTVTTNQQVYVEGTAFSNGNFTVSSNVFVSEGSLTSGRYYVPIGQSYSTTNIRLNATNQQVYYYDGTNLKPVEDYKYQPSGSYAASSHTHTKSQITDFPTSMTPTAHTDSSGAYGKATTSVWGHTKLNSATNSTDETTAATPKAVKAAYDLANGKPSLGTTSTTAAKGDHTHDYSKVSVSPTKTSGVEIGRITVDGTEKILYQQDNNTTYSAVTQSANGLMTKEDKQKLDKSMAISAGNAGGTTSAYTATLTGVTLTHGTVIALYNAVGNNVANATLNVNSLGAKPIYYQAGAIPANRFPNKATGIFMYNTTIVSTGCWQMIYSWNENSFYYLTSANSIEAGEALASTRLVACKKADGKYYYLSTLASTAINTAEPILLTNGAFTAGQKNSATTLHHPWVGFKNSYSGITAEAYKTVYVEGTAYANNQLTLSSTPLTATLTSGRYYIRIGTTYNATPDGGVDLTNQKVMYYDGTNLKPVEEYKFQPAGSYAASGHNHNTAYLSKTANDTTTGKITAAGFIVNGATSGHFVKADGTTAAANNYSHPSTQQCTHTHNYIPSNADGTTTGNLTATTSGKGIITANKFVKNAPSSTNNLLKTNGDEARISNTAGISVTSSTTGGVETISIGHSNTAINAQTTSALKKIKYDAYGHITGTDDVSSSDLPSHTHDYSDTYAPKTHTHASRDVTGLTASKNVVTNSSGALTTEAKNNHTHDYSSITGLSTNKNVVTDSNGKITTESKSNHTHSVASITNLLSTIYPIGSIYMNIDSTKDPNSLIGGIWVQISQGRMLLGAGTAPEDNTKTYTAGDTDGSKDAVVVSHHHNAAGNTQFISGNDGSIGRTGKRAFAAENSGGIRYLYDNGTSITDSCCTTDQGVDGTDMNMPPYLVVYMWKRTA